MVLGEGLARLSGYPFEVRHSEGATVRARAAADITVDAYDYCRQLFPTARPDLALIVAAEADWQSRQPYGLPFFNDDDGQIRPGILVMPAGSGDFWRGIADDLREAPPEDLARLRATYPDGAGGVDLQPFFDLITIHELGHAFEMLGGLRLPTFWLSEIFANLVLHAFVVNRRPQSRNTLETLSLVGSRDPALERRTRATGYSTLEQLQEHYTGGSNPMDALNYVWFQYRFQRLAAAIYDADGEVGLVRFWQCFDPSTGAPPTSTAPLSLAPILGSRVSETLGRAIEEWS